MIPIKVKQQLEKGTWKEKFTFNKPLLNVIFDLESVLVNFDDDPDDSYDFTIHKSHKHTNKYLYVKKRPGLDIFLRNLSYFANIIIFSDSSPFITEQIIDNIDPHRHILKQVCYSMPNIENIDLNFSRTIIVNNEIDINNFESNNLQIDPYLGSGRDYELYDLFKSLMKLYNVDDVRTSHLMNNSF